MSAMHTRKWKAELKAWEKKMEIYRFDFKEFVHGTFEIEAEQKFMDMSLRDLLKYSNHASDGTERKIRFVTVPQNMA